MNDFQLGWQDPVDQLNALRVAVKHLRATRLGPRKRFDRATFPLTKYWGVPERLKHRRENILNARTAVRRDYRPAPCSGSTCLAYRIVGRRRMISLPYMRRACSTSGG
jgi:hypothetical protein